MGVSLEESATAWRVIRKAWARLRPGVTVPDINRQQALVPLGGSWLANDRGTAPGLLAHIGSCQVACLPGVPHEMLAMAQRLARRLPRLVPGLIRPVVAEVWFSGIGESTAQERIADLFSERDPQVGITVSEAGHITLRVVGRGPVVRRRARELAARLTGHVLPAPGLAASLVAELARRGQIMTAAESCTCGQVAAQLGAVPGASAVWQAGIIAYHDAVKRRLLGVPAALLRRHGAVSCEVVAAMAAGARSLARADVAVATSGIAGPGGGTATKPVGLVWLACATRSGVVTREVRIRGERERIQRRAAAAALQLVWDVLHGRVAANNAAH
jgi:nicotinamide-nucleotide amidase